MPPPARCSRATRGAATSAIAIAFADLGGAQTAWTGDRTEFLGRNGAPASPAALSRRETLSGRTGAAFDPCCALQTTLEIPAGGTATVVWLLGQTETREQARALIQRYRVGRSRRAARRP